METVNNKEKKYEAMYSTLKKAKIFGFYVHDIETHDNRTRFHFTLTTDAGLFEAELVEFDNFDEEHLLKVFRPGFGDFLKDTVLEILESNKRDFGKYNLKGVIILDYIPRTEKLKHEKVVISTSPTKKNAAEKKTSNNQPIVQTKALSSTIKSIYTVTNIMETV
jgi:hypothetical protein